MGCKQSKTIEADPKKISYLNHHVSDIKLGKNNGKLNNSYKRKIFYSFR